MNTPTWKEIVSSYSSENKFNEPVTEDQLKSLEKSLKIQLPQELKGILLETNGIVDEYGTDVIWTADEILKQNQNYWEGYPDLYMPFKNLLFFGSDGGGDMFAFAIQEDGKIHNPDIYRWEHETDSRSWFAGRMQQFFEFFLKKGTQS